MPASPSRSAVEADEHYNVQALLEEAGVQQIHASWGCECGDEAGDAEARCQCKCKSAGPGNEGWETVHGEDGHDVSCFMGVGGECHRACAVARSFLWRPFSLADHVILLIFTLRFSRGAVRTANGSMRHLGHNGVVARRGECGTSHPCSSWTRAVPPADHRRLLLPSPHSFILVCSQQYFRQRRSLPRKGAAIAPQREMFPMCFPGIRAKTWSLRVVYGEGTREGEKRSKAEQTMRQGFAFVQYEVKINVLYV